MEQREQEFAEVLRGEFFRNAWRPPKLRVPSRDVPRAMTALASAHDGIALLRTLGASPWLVRHHELVVEAATLICDALEQDLGVSFDRHTVLVGASIHAELVSGYTYVPARDRSSAAAFLCLGCRANLGPEALVNDSAIVKRHDHCPKCGLSILAATEPPSP